MTAADREDLEELPPHVRRKLDIVFATELDDVLGWALVARSKKDVAATKSREKVAKKRVAARKSK